MKRALGLAILGLCASPLLAGEIYGTVTEGGKSVGEGIAIAVKCGGESYPAKTDKGGAYHLVVREKGKCSLTVHYKDQTPSVDVASYDDGVQVDLVLESKDGKYTLRRK